MGQPRCPAAQVTTGSSLHCTPAPHTCTAGLPTTSPSSRSPHHVTDVLRQWQIPFILSKIYLCWSGSLPALHSELVQSQVSTARCSSDHLLGCSWEVGRHSVLASHVTLNGDQLQGGGKTGGALTPLTGSRSVSITCSLYCPV